MEMNVAEKEIIITNHALLRAKNRVCGLYSSDEDLRELFTTVVERGSYLPNRTDRICYDGIILGVRENDTEIIVRTLIADTKLVSWERQQSKSKR